MFNLFNAKPKLNTSVLLWLTIAAIFVIISVGLLTQTPTVQANSHGLSSIFEGEIVACDGLADCNLCTLIETAQNVVLFLVGFSVVVAILMFVFAGFLLVTAGANDGQLSRGKGIFWSVFIGLFIVLAAWLIINLILSTFLAPEYGTWYDFDCTVETTAEDEDEDEDLVATPPKFCYFDSSGSPVSYPNQPSCETARQAEITGLQTQITDLENILALQVAAECFDASTDSNCPLPTTTTFKSCYYIYTGSTRVLTETVLPIPLCNVNYQPFKNDAISDLQHIEIADLNSDKNDVENSPCSSSSFCP